MSIIINYQEIIKIVLTEYIKIPQQYQKKDRRFNHNHNSYSNIESQLVISEDCKDYLLIVYGFDIPESVGFNTWQTSPIQDCIIHLEIDRDIIKIHQDKLEHKITNQLIEAGISEDKIIQLYPGQQPCVEYIVNSRKIYELDREYFTTDSSFKNPILKPNLTAAELIKLTKIRFRFINIAVAQYPNTPPNILKQLFKDFPVEVLNNPIMDLLILENSNFLQELFDIEPYIFYKQELKLPDYFIQWAVTNGNEEVRQSIANNENISLHWLKQLLEDRSCLVIQKLYRNLKLPLSIKEKLYIRRLQLEKKCPHLSENGCNHDLRCPLYKSELDEIPF
ncbi:hypothetical protein H1P_1590002 [Hyella patelloides LEGE 07179]|uniref:Uncharacterized protein n=1 Tax=Hyella patelloides LEGE 07179 TaxID=945734 RepID=A0A563VMK2_9CYAN|nr:element excision factor XisI family protein [Hyella patelloides]VEP12648.1 hypothetical protein H1P_1590002 [Hyella patelloides LEGE 07179]